MRSEKRKENTEKLRKNLMETEESIQKSPLREMSMDFAVHIVALARELRNGPKEYALADQVLRSGTSIGANLSEAVYAASRPDFLNKNKIALKECSETLYWLTLAHRCNLLSPDQARPLISTCDQLRRMIISVCKTLESRK
jgi:four helix bundle protein